jgi:uncharacterized protein (DUF1800 family)/5-hydroxyisourate hydrolase-like protein (transthyretin family)
MLVRLIRSLFPSFCRSFLIPLFFMAIATGSAFAQSLTVGLLDDVSGAGLPGVEIQAYERLADGTKAYRGKGVTNSTGSVKFDLEGLDSGRSYQFEGKPFSHWLVSDAASKSGWFGFKVGKIQIQVRDGQNGQPKAGQAVALKKWMADGNHVGLINTMTDAQGWVKLDPPAVGTDPYVLVATSPTDGQIKVSPRYWNKGPHTFVLGNAPVVVRLQDAVSGANLGSQWVEVWEKVAGVGPVFRHKRWTDATGAVSFDLDGLGEGRIYLVKAQPYLQAVESVELTQAGTQVLKVGKLQVQLLDGRTDTAYAGTNVTLNEVQADGTLKSVGTYKTDGEGRLRLDPVGLGSKSYALQAASPFDGRTKTSSSYPQGGSYVFKVGSPGVTVGLLDDVSGAGLPGVEIQAYERLADGTKAYRGKGVTNSTGSVKFDLEGLDSGRSYQFEGKPFSHWLVSDAASKSGWFGFKVGKIQIQVRDGQNGQPKAGQAVALKKWMADGNHVGLINTMTDAQGWVKLDPPAVGTDPYVLVATSPTDGQIKVSPRYWNKGPHTFVLGNAPVVVRLQDAVSGANLGSQWVEVWEKVAGVGPVFRHKRWTDATGAVSFDLDGLGEGRIYLVKAQPYLQAVESVELTQAGTQVLKVGKLQVQLLDGRTDTAYAGTNVTLNEVQADGTLKSVGTYKTDGEGRLRLDPVGLGSKSYALQAASPFDGRTKTSSSYPQGGSYVFKVGSPGVTVGLLDDVSGAGLPGVEIQAYERLADGTKAYRGKGVTNSTGSVKFDLEGLDSGRSYQFEGKPFSHWLVSDAASKSGWFGFKVGKIQIQVRDGQNGQPKAGQAVALKKWMADGNHVGLINTMTDAQGWVKLDPPAVGTDPYVLVATSPTDGQIKVSPRYWNKGPHTFVLGNAPVVVRLQDAVSGANLGSQWVEVWEKVAGVGPVFRHKRWTDATGAVSFDLDGLGEGRIYLVKAQPYLQAVESVELTQAGTQVLKVGKLQVQLLDGRTDTAYAGTNVTLNEVQADGTLKSVGTYKTDGEGRLRLDPVGLGSKSYALQAASPFDGRTKTSSSYPQGGSYVFKVGSPGVTVGLLDDVSGAGLPGVEIQAYERLADGTKAYRGKGVTNSTGSVKFDLEGLDSGRSYQFEGKPFSHWLVSDAASKSGWFGFKVGKIQIQVRDGQNGQPKAGQAVALKKWMADGNHVGLINTMTDAQGWVKLDPPAVGTDPYVLVATSPTDGQIKVSPRYWNKGPHTFVLGNAPVVVRLQDAVSGANLGSQWVEVWEKVAGVGPVFRHKRWTDATGAVSFDLDGLGEGRIYLVKAQPYLQAVESVELTQAGTQVLKVGKLQVQLLDGRTDTAYAGTNVTLNEVQADGTLKSVGTYKTDGEGRLRLDPVGLGSKSYALQAASPFDGRTKTSSSYPQGGSYVFKVGSPGVTVGLLDDVSGAGLPGVEIQAYERLADGTKAYRGKGVTNSTGSVKFDLEGLDSGRSYQFEGKPFSHWLVSDAASKSGWFGFKVGKIQIQVRDGQNGQPKAGQAVALKKWMADGNHVGLINTMTDAQGWVKLDPPAVGTDPYVLVATSPTDGQIKVSPRYWNKGPHTFVLGNAPVVVRLQDAVSGANLGSQWVEVWEKVAGVGPVFRHKRWTDATGAVSFDLDGLGEGRIYLVKAQPYLQAVESVELTQAGTQVLKVGKLQVQLLDGRTDTAYAGTNVTLNEVQADGTLKSVGTYKTDGEGRLRLDPVGLGSKSYALQAASPFDGRTKTSSSYPQGGSYVFKVGALGVKLKLVDDVTGAAVAGHEVHVFERTLSGSKVWRARQTTDAAGNANFDLDGQESRGVLNFETKYYELWETSGQIMGAGVFTFRVGKLRDRNSPSVSILAPAPRQKISVSGVRLIGSASDDEGIRDVKVTFALPSGAVVEKNAIYRSSTQSWSVHSGTLIPDAGTVQIAVIASDQANNQTKTTLDLELIIDTTAPVLTILTHRNGGQIPTGGFVVSGMITDDALDPTLSATLSGGGLTAPLAQEIEVAQASGRWAMTIAPEQSFSNLPVTLSLTARDAGGNKVTSTMALQPVDVFGQAWHTLQRTSLGAGPQAYSQAVQAGAATFLQQQLNPEGVDDIGLEQRQAMWPTDGTHIATRLLRRSTYSSRQLREVMTWFWDNHFNTNYVTHQNSDFEKRETDAFRTHALGNFRALIGESARSPAMLYTLDGLFNMKGRPNENYARELMELHSMGVTGGYTQRDVEEVARAFTGWTVKDGVFFFDTTKHDTAAKAVLGRTIAAGGGLSDGEAVLDFVATHPSTARFVCRKLVTLFVSDQPVESLVTRCASTFLAQQASPDQMKQVLATILGSPEFLGTTYRGAKLKTPIEFVVGAVRQFGGEDAGDDLGLEVQRQGMPLFMNPSPTGFGETGTSWLSTSMLLSRSRFADRLLSYNPGAAQTQFSLAAAMSEQGYVTAEGVAGRMLEWTLGPTFVRRHRQLALDVLTEDGTYPYFPNAPDAEIRLRRLGKALMALPEYQYQ